MLVFRVQSSSLVCGYAHIKTRQGVVFFHFHDEFNGTCGIYLVQVAGEVIQFFCWYGLQDFIYIVVSKQRFDIRWAAGESFLFQILHVQVLQVWVILGCPWWSHNIVNTLGSGTQSEFNITHKLHQVYDHLHSTPDSQSVIYMNSTNSTVSEWLGVSMTILWAEYGQNSG